MKNKKLKVKKDKKLIETADAFVSKDDAFGSYTGNSLFGGKPEQDADDL